MHPPSLALLAWAGCIIKFCPLDWRTTIHWNVFLAIFQHNRIRPACSKNTRSTFECMVILKSRGQGLYSCWKYWTDWSRGSQSFLDIVPWIGEYPYTLMWYFSNNLDIYDYVGKLPEQHFSVWLFSNPGDKILFLLKFNEARILEWYICNLPGSVILNIFMHIFLHEWELQCQRKRGNLEEKFQYID